MKRSRLNRLDKLSKDFQCPRCGCNDYWKDRHHTSRCLICDIPDRHEQNLLNHARYESEFERLAIIQLDRDEQNELF